MPVPQSPFLGWKGPTAISTGKEWFIYYDMYGEIKMCAISSTDLRHWNDITDSISFPQGTRHGTVLKITKSELDKLLNKNDNQLEKQDDN